MGSVRVVVCLVAVGALFVTAGCGSSGSTTGSGSPTTSAAHSSDAPKMLTNGIKGERPGEEAASSLRLSAADCRALGRIVEDRFGAPMTHDSTPTPPLSKCRIEGPGVHISAFLDTGFAANRRYTNRIDETVQFNTQHPAGLPRPVAHVGEKSYGNSAASWIPALGSLLAVRGNRWLTVTISVDGLSGRRLRAEAAVLARAGFKLSATG